MIRPFELKDYHEVVMMYKDLIKTIYPNRQIGHDINFYRMVDNWIKANHHIFVSEHNGTLTGFFCAYVHYNYGLTEPVYFGEAIYVKPEFRKSKSAYALYHKIIEIADELKLKTVSHAYIESGANKLHVKLGSYPTFIITERPQGV